MVQRSSTRFNLLAINHSERESIEFFDLDAGVAHVRAVWRGCLRLPSGVVGNGVTSLPDGRIVASGGGVAIWAKRVVWRRVSLDQGGRANGVVASPDGHWLYVNITDRHQVLRVPVDEADI